VTFHMRGFVLLVFVLALALLGGAGGSTASTATHCNMPAPTGRQFCVTVEDIDGVSPSGLAGSGKRQVNVEAYQFYKLTIQNVAGTSTLTNGTMSVVLTDNFPGGATAPSTALYVPSAQAPSCAVVSTNPNRVDCALGNLAAGASTPTMVLGYRTSTSPGVTSTDAGVTIGFKEGSNPNGANPSSLAFAENTSLEPDPEASVAWSPSAQNVQLGTSPTFDSQFTTLQYKVPAGKPPFTATMNESNGTLCAPGLKQCFGELVTTDLSGAATGTFSATNPFHLVLTMDYALFPGGSTKSIAVTHKPDSGPIETISRRCSSDPPGPTEALPCITVDVVGQGQAKLLVIGVWGSQNGGWHPGLD
jgi:hypothetical protein